MKNRAIYSLLLFCLFILPSFSQTTDIVILNDAEEDRLKKLVKENDQAKQHLDSIIKMVSLQLEDIPRPLKVVHYEGLLQTDSKRIGTEKSLEDVDKVVNLIYSHYGNGDAQFAEKAKGIVTAWVNRYQPTGNPINENKFVPFFWAYMLFKDHFSQTEKTKVEDWMISIAEAQVSRASTPNNNWEAKRLKIIATVGCILDRDALKRYAVDGFKMYIQSAYYPDGTSNDLIERDALRYHNSGLKPTVGVFVNCSAFDPAFDLYLFEAPNGTSIRKSVAYVIPYAKGEKTREEWTNSKVALDKKRAEAGLAAYQPGMRFDPKDAIPLFEWASYYDRKLYSLFGPGSAQENFFTTWVGLLNSPLVRENNF